MKSITNYKQLKLKIMNKQVKSVVKSQVINAIYTIVLNQDLNFPTGSFIVDTPNMGKIEIEEMFFCLYGNFICYYHTIGHTDDCLNLVLENLDLNTLITLLQHISK
jgi:hypothetical protein